MRRIKRTSLEAPSANDPKRTALCHALTATHQIFAHLCRAMRVAGAPVEIAHNIVPVRVRQRRARLRTRQFGRGGDYGRRLSALGYDALEEIEWHIAKSRATYGVRGSQMSERVGEDLFFDAMDQAPGWSNEHRARGGCLKKKWSWQRLQTANGRCGGGVCTRPARRLIGSAGVTSTPPFSRSQGRARDSRVAFLRTIREQQPVELFR